MSQIRGERSMAIRQLPPNQLLLPRSDPGRSGVLTTSRHRLKRDIWIALAQTAHDRVKSLMALLRLEFQRAIPARVIETSRLRAKDFP